MKKNNRLSVARFPLIALLFLLAFALPLTSQNNVLAEWNPTGSGFINGGISPWAPTYSDPNVTVSNLSRATGLSAGNINTVTGCPANAWGGAGWEFSNTPPAAPGWDITFTVSAGSGNLSMSSLELNYGRTVLGPSLGIVQCAVGSGTYTIIANLSYSNTTVATPIPTVNLSAIPALQGLPANTPVKFRIVNFGTAFIPTGRWFLCGTGLRVSGSVSGGNTASISPVSTIQCHGQTTGALMVAVTGTNSPYTYSWMPSGGNASIASGLGAGVYSCVVTDAFSHTTVSTYTVTQPPAFVATLSAQSNVSCYNGADGSAAISCSGGVQPYNYTWQPAVASGSANTNLSAGSYTVSTSDANGCGNDLIFNVTQPVKTLSAHASILAVCEGSDVVLAGTGASTYTWSGGITNNTAFSPTATSVYTLHATNASGCSDTALILITVYPAPTLTASCSKTAACVGQSVTLSALGNATSYLWNTGHATANVTLTPSNVPGLIVYTVTGTDANGCSATRSATLTLSACTGIEENEASGLLPLVFPNPCNGTATIRYNGELELVDHLGKTIRSFSPDANTHEYILSGLNAGVYFIKAKDKPGLIQKLLVMQ